MFKAYFGNVRGSKKNKQNILGLKTVQLSTYPLNKTIYLGTELIGGQFVGAELVRGRVCLNGVPPETSWNPQPSTETKLLLIGPSCKTSPLPIIVNYDNLQPWKKERKGKNAELSNNKVNYPTHLHKEVQKYIYN